uniref:Metallo-beta-lactamase domain-containing protein n=1 Tax=Plectus sambesii TaxID=2011161 RepID=A0A914UKB0_9BILA
MLSISFFVILLSSAALAQHYDPFNRQPYHPKRRPHQPATKSPPTAGKARVTIIDQGLIVSKQNGNGKDFEFVATVALIEDSGKKIIFDTATATDNDSKQRMINGLKRLGIETGAINYVILSHAHLDHTGHANAFQNAKIYFGSHVFSGHSLKYIGTYEFGEYNVTSHVKIVPTPGHTSSCISALVSNAQQNNIDMGTIAITGDLFFKVEDLTDASIWQGSATDIAQQATSRASIMCDADYIIPGHGPLFKVPTTAKTSC